MKTRSVGIALAVACIAVACRPGLSVEEKREMLEAKRRQEYAELVRHEGECRAVAVEFPADRWMLENCMDTHRQLIDGARLMIENIDKRLIELDRTGR